VTKTVRQITGAAGRNGTDVRSDCHVTVSLTASGGIRIGLKSKVDALYGNAIRAQIIGMMEEFGIRNSEVTVTDQGAVPFVIAARLETALLRCGIERPVQTAKEIAKKVPVSKKERFRRTRLYLPGNEPHYFLNAGLHKPDGIILDLEDSVAPSEKEAARLLVRNALLNVDFGAAERMVRINQLPLGIDDLQAVIPAGVQTILVPKCESAEQLRTIDAEIDRICQQHSVKRTVLLLPIIESALGVVRAFEIAAASPWNCALAIGLEDYTADIGAERTAEGRESLFARSAVINAAKAAGIQALDSVYSNVSDDAGLRASVTEAKALGFEGKGCIHPRQIAIVHDALAPTEKEIEYARRVVDAFNEAKKNGSGVVALGSKMIDAPVVKRAERILAQVNGRR